MSADAFCMPAGRYFLSHSIGLRPRAADQALEEGFSGPWRRGAADAWDYWLAAVARFCETLAPLIGAKPDDICPQTNVSSALSKILFSLPDRARRKKIVATEDDFSTIGFVLAQAERLGYALSLLPGGARLAEIDAWAPAFRDDVQLVLATHVFSNTSVRTPVGEIVEQARRRGVFTILDIAQSAGAVPVDLGRWRPDFAVGTSVKYLCGGPGAAFLWTEAETAARCRPLDVGWFSHAEPFEMDIRSFRYAAGARRFWGGTPSVAPFVVAAAGFRALADVGIDAICAHNQQLLTRLFNGLPTGAVRSHGESGKRGSSAVIAVKNVGAASAALLQNAIAHDVRGGLRVSVHLYNNEEDVDALLGALKDWV